MFRRGFCLLRNASTLSPALMRKVQGLVQQYTADVGSIKDSQQAALLSRISELHSAMEGRRNELQQLRQMVDEEADAELVTLAEEDATVVEGRLEEAEQALQQVILDHMSKQQEDVTKVILQIRPAAGGSEAGLFAEDLFRMYEAYSARQRWRWELLSNPHDSSVKEAVVRITGADAWEVLMLESGVHRVQRVPATERSGRMHTSTATVSVLPELQSPETVLNEKDLKIDNFRPGGPGGQAVNKSNAGCRITHLPTEITISIQDDRSFMLNKEKGLKILAERVYQFHMRAARNEWLSQQKSHVGTGDRSEKIRTYNFPANRITDHRIGLHVHNLDAVLDGELDKIVTELRLHKRHALLQEWAESE